MSIGRIGGLAETAATAGYSVDVVCLRRPEEKAYEVCNGVRLHRLSVSRHYGGSLPILVLSWCCFLFLATIKITRLHGKYRYDVVHVHNIPDFLVFSTLFARLAGARIILDVQDVTPELMAVKCKGRLRSILMRLAIWQDNVVSLLKN